MIDTLKLGIPLTQKQFERIHGIAFSANRPQWALFYPDTGELRLRRVSGLLNADQESFHREIRWDVSPTYRAGEAFLIVELSLPKFWYGHNIHLLYDFVAALERLKNLLDNQFNLKTSGRLPKVWKWEVYRVDCCYAWRVPSQAIAQQLLDSLKHIHFPRKRPIIYPTAILFAGTTYSLKFYLKLPEFKTHDLKALIKANAPLEWVNHLESKAEGVMRCEATLRRKYLDRQNIRTVADLTRPLVQMEFEKDAYPEDCNLGLVIDAIVGYQTSELDLDSSFDLWEVIQDGQRLNAPEGYEIWVADPRINNGETFTYRHTGAGFLVRKRDNPTAILEYLLEKFLGENRGMQHVDEVEAKLMEAYKPVKAARLVSMWLYVQRFGTQKAKEVFGHNSYYVAKRDMKKAGVSLVEPPKNVIRMERDFWQSFQLEIPSPHATNHHDDFRESDNLLNFIPKASGNP